MGGFEWKQADGNEELLPDGDNQSLWVLLFLV